MAKKIRSSNLYNIEQTDFKYKSRRFGNSHIVFRKYIKIYRYIIIGVLVAVVVHYSSTLLSKSEKLKISNIQVFGAQTFVDENDLKNLILSKVSGIYYFDVDTTELKTIAQENFQGAKEITVSKKLPNTVVITVVERTPLALVTNPKSSEYYLVDEEGYILGIVDRSSNNLPVITYNDVLHVGLFIDKATVPLYLELLQASAKEGLATSTISMQTRYISFILNENIQVYLSKAKDITGSIELISQLLKQENLKGKSVKKIDLRYDKVVVEMAE